jgi:hypothetical protein
MPSIENPDYTEEIRVCPYVMQQRVIRLLFRNQDGANILSKLYCPCLKRLGKSCEDSGNIRKDSLCGVIVNYESMNLSTF